MKRAPVADPYGLRVMNSRIGNPRTVAHSPRYYFWQKVVRNALKTIWALMLLAFMFVIGWFIFAMVARVVLGIV